MSFDWNTEIRPVLDALNAAIDVNGTGYADSGEINSMLGRDTEDRATDRALTKLRDAGFIKGYRGAEGWSNCTLEEKGLQIVAGWPTRPGDDTYDQLLAILEQRIESASTNEEKSKWVKLRDGFASAGRDFAIDLLSNLAAQSA
ncbi:MAG: hypothetical protein JST31_03800 [Actinobacteria bacterium]|nr:hypothetical protein [Actinomycetota bacterium]